MYIIITYIMRVLLLCILCTGGACACGPCMQSTIIHICSEACICVHLVHESSVRVSCLCTDFKLHHNFVPQVPASLQTLSLCATCEWSKLEEVITKPLQPQSANHHLSNWRSTRCSWFLRLSQVVHLVEVHAVA